MDFAAAVRTCRETYAVFQGRARRAEHWSVVLFNLGANALANLLDAALRVIAFGLIASLGLLRPAIGAGVRRLYDSRLSGWWMLSGLGGSLIGGARLPVSETLGLLALLAGGGLLPFLLAQPGTPGPNRFGPGPTAL